MDGCCLLPLLLTKGGHTVLYQHHTEHHAHDDAYPDVEGEMSHLDRNGLHEQKRRLFAEVHYRNHRHSDADNDMEVEVGLVVDVLDFVGVKCASPL